MKKLFFMLLTILSVTLLAGCGGARSEIKQMAFMEQTMIEQISPMADNINKSYTKWQAGEITREQLASDLAVHYQKINSINNDWNTAKNDLSRFAKNNASLWKISYMGSICYDLQQFLASATQGYPSCVTNSNKKPISDSELKASYENNMVHNYNRNKEKALKGIHEVITFF